MDEFNIALPGKKYVDAANQLERVRAASHHHHTAGKLI